jgi:hypothetical protein
MPLMTLERGGIFGEDNLLFNTNNSYSVKPISNKCSGLSIHYNEVKRELKKWLPAFGE